MARAADNGITAEDDITLEDETNEIRKQFLALVSGIKEMGANIAENTLSGPSLAELLGNVMASGDEADAKALLVKNNKLKRLHAVCADLDEVSQGVKKMRDDMWAKTYQPANTPYHSDMVDRLVGANKSNKDN